MKLFYSFSLTLVLSIFISFHSFAQQYFPFPTEDAQWNGLNWVYVPNMVNWLYNYEYIQSGDTVINDISYHKIYYENSDAGDYFYLGAIREDENRQIFFFPSLEYPDTDAWHHFPNNTSEHLLYTFDNLEVGMEYEIGSFNIYIQSIDSILLNDDYRKRYEVHGGMLEIEYWIEGIGSDKDLLSIYSGGQFENTLYTLCYTDTEIYYINSPNGEDSCQYHVPVGIEEKKDDGILIYPNPVDKVLTIEWLDINTPALVNIYNVQGQMLLQQVITNKKTKVDLSSFFDGVYFVEIIQGDIRIRQKVLK